LAAHSRHPVSRAILAAAGPQQGPVPNFDSVEEIPGYGVEARANGFTWRLGRASWAVGRDDAEGTVLSRDGRMVAAFRIRDALRPGAVEAIRSLNAKGIPVEILSGDGYGPVAEVAGRLGVDFYRAALLPGDKTGHLATLAADGKKVLMVGDGLNDAPALAAAHVSMAPATAADIGRNAADFVFLRESLEAVPVAL